MPEIHAGHHGVFGPFTKNKERIHKFKEAGDSQHIYQKELNKGRFQQDMAYGDFKDITRRTTSDKILRDKVVNIAKNPKHDGCHHGIDSMVYKSFDKKTSSNCIKNDNISIKELAKELHKPVI